GWHWGFGAAAVGMLAGLALYASLRARLLGDIGAPPPGRQDLSLAVALAGIAAAALAAVGYHTGALATVGGLVAGRAVTLVLGAAAVAWTVRFVGRLAPEERGPTITIFVYMLFNAV